MDDLRKLFSKIYDEHIDKIYRFVYLKVNSREIAEDLTSEAFSKTWAVFRTKKEIENIKAFLYKTARNLVTDYYRQKGKIRIVAMDNPFLVDPRYNLEEEAKVNSDILYIRKALSDLKEDYQNVIIWYYLDDLSIGDISKILGRTEQTTRVLLHRALKALKNKLEPSLSKEA